MLVLTNLRRNGTVDVLVVMGEENMRRIREYDPAEISWHEFPPEYRNRMPGTIAITFATAEEMERIEKLAMEGRKGEAFELVTRGFRFRPEEGDHDGGPILLGKKREREN